MADPMTMAIAGAGLGAMTSDDPLKGALMGGVGGFAGGHFFNGLGQAGSGLGAAGEVTGSAAFTPAQFNAALFKDPSKMMALGEMGSAAGLMPEASSILGAKTLLPSTFANQAATASVNPLLAGARTFANDLPFSNNSSSMIKAGQMMQGDKEPPPPVVAPPPPMINPMAGADFSNAQNSPYNAQVYPYGQMPGSPFMSNSPSFFPQRRF